MKKYLIAVSLLIATLTRAAVLEPLDVQVAAISREMVIIQVSGPGYGAPNGFIVMWGLANDPSWPSAVLTEAGLKPGGSAFVNLAAPLTGYCPLEPGATYRIRVTAVPFGAFCDMPNGEIVVTLPALPAPPKPPTPKR